MFSDVTDPVDLIHQTVGAASLCWQYPEKAGVFADDRARAVAEACLERLCQLGYLRTGPLYDDTHPSRSWAD